MEESLLRKQKSLEDELPKEPVLPKEESIYVDIPQQFKQLSNKYAKYEGPICLWCEQVFKGPISLVPIIIPCDW